MNSLFNAPGNNTLGIRLAGLPATHMKEMSYFSAVGVEATFLDVCHTGVMCALLAYGTQGRNCGLLSVLMPNLRGTERSDIVVNLHCGLWHQRGFSVGAQSGAIVGARFGQRRLSRSIPLCNRGILVTRQLSHTRP